MKIVLNKYFRSFENCKIFALQVISTGDTIPTLGNLTLAIPDP